MSDSAIARVVSTAPRVPGRHVPVRDERYFVRDTGGDGPPVLLLHGWPDDSTLFRHQQAALAAAGYRALAVDWPMHGESSRPDRVSRCATPDLARDIVSLLDALGLARVHLVAHDYGATVSWEMVAANPHRFATFAAISVGHSAEVLADVLRCGLVRYHWLLLHGLSFSVRWYLAHDARRFRRKFGSHPDADTILKRLRDGTGERAFTIWEKANPAPAVAWRALFGAAERRKILVPTLGVYGRDDEWMTAGQMARSYRHVDAPWQYEAVDGGHWLPLERPDDVTSRLLRWIEAFPLAAQSTIR